MAPATGDNRTPIPNLRVLEEDPSIDLSEVVKLDEQNTQHALHLGGFSDVWLGWLENESSTPMKVAVKVLRLGGSNENRTQQERFNLDAVRRYLNREAQAWRGMNHCNVLRFLGLSRKLGRPGCPALISPYCDHGTIKQYLERNPRVDRVTMVKGIARGLEYLHLNDVVHGDLKPNNVLIGDSGNPLICDFGRSKILTHSGFTATKPAGACRYQAPELMEGQTGPTKASDIYAFAISSYEIWTDEEPYRDLNDVAIIMSVLVHKKRPGCPSPPIRGQHVIWPTLQECWKTIASDRLAMQEVVERLSM